MRFRALLVAQLVKNPPAMQKTLVPFLGQEDLQEKTPVFMDVLGGSAGKKSAYNVGDHPWVGKIPWRREQLPTPVFWLGGFHGLYSPWGRKELDTTERLSLSSSQPGESL